MHVFPWVVPFALLIVGFLFLFPVGGAVLEDGDGTDLTQVYNPKTCTWTELAPMQIARSGSAACTLKGKLYVIGVCIISNQATTHKRSIRMKSSKMMNTDSHSLPQGGGMPRQRTLIRWSATIPKPTSGPCVLP